MLDGAASQMAMIYAWHAVGLWHAGRGSNLLDGAAPFYRCYECADGKHIAVGAIEPQFFAALMAGLGLDGEDWNQSDRSAWPAMAERIAGVVATRARDAWVATFDGTDACVSPVLGLAEAPGHPHNRARGTFTGPPDQPAPGPRFSNHAGAVRACPTTPDAERAAVLAAWGV